MQLTSPKTTFSNDDLTELHWVFASVCEALEAEQGKLNEKEKTRIRRRLFEMVGLGGMTDPQSERDHLIRSFTHATTLRKSA
jgi:hypothetical protein